MDEPLELVEDPVALAEDSLDVELAEEAELVALEDELDAVAVLPLLLVPVPAPAGDAQLDGAPILQPTPQSAE
jgi:hypothetical protein